MLSETIELILFVIIQPIIDIPCRKLSRAMNLHQNIFLEKIQQLIFLNIIPIYKILRRQWTQKISIEFIFTIQGTRHHPRVQRFQQQLQLYP